MITSQSMSHSPSPPSPLSKTKNKEEPKKKKKKKGSLLIISSRFQRLRGERRTLNKEIREYYRLVFSSGTLPTESSDEEADVKMEELVGKLSALKQNLEDEKRLILQTHGAMSKILTPRYASSPLTSPHPLLSPLSTLSFRLANTIPGKRPY